jgi:peptidoglycan/LPS O-acetylase OafA/YrhL
MAHTEIAEKTVAGDQAHYRAHLDGLRAVAVYLVVAFHAGLGAFTGGFIGVDVFFVLSGYLVTGILLRHLVGSGRVNFREFYSRRFRRILPAACAALVATALVYAIVATPVETRDVLGGFKAAFLYVANWYFIRQSVNYFAADINQSPVLHFWSLAVEEQFYLVWPLLFGAIFLATRRMGRFSWWALRGIVAAMALASAIAAWHIAATNLNRAYYGTDTRAYQLLCGALLALTPQLMRLARRYVGVAHVVGPLALIALGGLVLVGSSLFDTGPIARGFLAVALSAVLIVALENRRMGPTARVLSSGPMAYLGRVSYATYLWHWPIIVIATHSRSVAPVPLFIVTAVLSTGLAMLSFHLVEHPLRASRWLDRYKTAVIGSGLAISVVAGVLVVPAILIRGSGSLYGASGVVLDWSAASKDIPPLPDCLHRPVSSCTVVQGPGKRILLVGDSTARMWIPTFTVIARERAMSLSVASFPNCPWQRGLQYERADTFTELCRKHQQDWYDRVIPQLAPDIVVLVHLAFDDSVRSQNLIAPDGHDLPRSAVDYESEITRAATSSLQALRAHKRKIVILEPIPIAPIQFNPLSCISNGGPLSQCAYRAGPSPTPLERFYRSVADGKVVVSLDADRLVCPRLPICDPVLDGMIVKRDGPHLTATFARSLAPELTALLISKAVLPPR